MEGLLDHPRAKRGSLDLRSEDRRLKDLERDAEEDNVPEWLTRGGGVWAGIANMSNSILGAGIIGTFKKTPKESVERVSHADLQVSFGRRSTLCIERSGITEWNRVIAGVGSGDGLDNSVDRSECENEWEEKLHRYYG